MAHLDPAEVSALRERIRARSPLAPDETERVLRKHYSSVLRVVPYLRARFDLHRAKVLDIGSSYGEHLLYWGPGSEGVEARSDAAAFTTAMGCPTHQINVEDDLGRLPAESFDAIHTNNLIEHLVSPHMFLVRCHRLLRPGGLLIVGHPVVPPRPARQAWSAAGLHGWLAVEHINFFTPAVIRLMLERSGFSVAEQFSPGFLRIASPFARWLLPLGASCYSVSRKVPDYRYARKRLAVFDPAVFRDELSVLREADAP